MTTNDKQVIKSKKAIKPSFECLECETINAQNDNDNKNLCNSVGSVDMRVHSNPTEENIYCLYLNPGHYFTRLSPLKSWIVHMM